MDSLKTTTNELINKRFEENRTRQGLPCSSRSVMGLEIMENVDVGVLDVNVDTGDEHPPTETTTSYSLSTSEVDDKSRKGSVDAKILPLVTLINSTNDLFTTSTCSGRIILFKNESVEKKIKKKGCQWLLVSHDEVQVDEMLETWRKLQSSEEEQVSFKVEAAILHVQAKKLSDAKKLLHTATESGFRNSGMVIGKDNRMTIAVRSALGFEVPLSTKNKDGIPFITDEYIIYLVEKANEKMNENWKRLHKLTEEFEKAFK